MKAPLAQFAVVRPLAPSLGRPLLAVGLGTLGLALCSYISVPMVPVPVTMQTFAVTMVGALFGWRLGAVTVLAWLAEAAMGAPVLANGAGGLAVFMGPTAGYLYSFPLVAALVGLLTARGWNGSRPLLCFGAMILGNLLCLALGSAWLAPLVGASTAMAVGVTPFLLGGLLKSALAAAVLRALASRRA